MTTCRCCGQAVLPGEAVDAARGDHGRSSEARWREQHAHGPAARPRPVPARVTINVDDALLLLCNRAYRLAEAQASECVEIAHLVVCLTAAPVPEYDFQREGIDRKRLSEAASAWLYGVARSQQGCAPRTSADMKALLSTAEAFAAKDARKFASPYDFIRALAHRRDAVASARFVGEAMGRRESVPALSERAPRAQPAERGDPAGERRGPRPSQLQFRFERRYQPQPGESYHREGREGSTRVQMVAPPDEPRDGVRRPLERDERAEFEPRSSEQRSGQRFDGGADASGREQEEKRESSRAVARPGRAPSEPRSAWIERLERQETLVADLVGLVSRVIDPRAAGGLRRRDDTAGVNAGFTDEAAARSGRTGKPQRSRSRLLWKRRRRMVIGAGARSSSPRDEADSGRRPPEGMLRVVSRNEPGVTARRPRVVREQTPDLDDAIGAMGDPDADDDGDGHAEGLGDRMKRFYLSPGDDIVKAPSIGPKTAARLTPVGLVLVRDLLRCDPEDIVLRTANRYITAGRISDWKAQARLVCTIPWLRGTHAQLLVGAGYDTLAKLSRADASSVCSAILRFAATREGQSILRSGPPPEIDRIACWIENTALAEPARAA